VIKDVAEIPRIFLQFNEKLNFGKCKDILVKKAETVAHEHIIYIPQK